MALIKCADCGKEVSDRAKTCPNCGCPIECSIPDFSDETTAETHVEKKPINRKKLFLIVGISVAVVLTVCVVLFAISHNKTNNSDDNSNNSDDSSYSSSSVNGYVGNNSNHEEKDNYESNFYGVNSYSDIQYISDRTVDYDSTNKYHRVFFGLKDANGNYISANSGTATIKIENTAGEVVYSEDVTFGASDFTSWTNSYWDTDRFLACIYIYDTELTKGSSEDGKLTISVVADNASFEATTIGVFNLPTKNITIELPSTPQSFSDYDYLNNLEATIRVDEVTYESKAYDYDDVTVTFSFLTTMTYNSTPGVSKYVTIGYKLKNSEGIIVNSGTIYVSQADTGDTSLTQKIIFDLNMKETYTLELSNSVD